MQSKSYAVIMAGGAGTRFWPLSRLERPKQLLPLGPSEEPLLVATVRRVEALVPKDRIYIVTSKALAEAVAELLPGVPRENILAEPAARNTAPCVGWAAAHVHRKDPEGVIAVLPADHYISDEPALIEAMRLGLETAVDGDLVTVGVRPTRPETGYGYVEVGEPLAEGVYRARRFVEKPNRQRAEHFLASGHFLWNAGMFFFRADVILEAIQKHLPGIGQALARFDAAAAEGREEEEVETSYAALPAVSFDHGVMEKAGDVAVIPCACGWSDLGSWTTAYELAPKDEHGNAIPEDGVALETSGCFATTTSGKVVALVGVRDLVIVDTEDALLVLPRSRAQEVKDVVAALKARRDPRI
jgi:mannose-1-phosphate guanylyltransferase